MHCTVSFMAQFVTLAPSTIFPSGPFTKRDTGVAESLRWPLPVDPHLGGTALKHGRGWLATASVTS